MDKAKQAEPLKDLPRKCPDCRSEKWNELSKIVSQPVGRIKKKEATQAT
jgi:hypothetical protein